MKGPHTVSNDLFSCHSPFFGYSLYAPGLVSIYFILFFHSGRMRSVVLSVCILAGSFPLFSLSFLSFVPSSQDSQKKEKKKKGENPPRETTNWKRSILFFFFFFLEVAACISFNQKMLRE
eukprot:TRINITY_DN4561_c5_g1_i1.p1 TRINITY_DN4561_c5_g1~~TRINITY_DN4561_c5_g1_i1.p1  ORF type:complete len:120 (-),score=4.34 TRINITY_DN4561_c5_g1_i1:481-840(-)